MHAYTMEDLLNQLTQKFGIDPEQAKTILANVSKTLLQKANPEKATELLSKLPSELTNMFSDKEKEQFTKTQENIDNNEIVRNMDKETGIRDESKTQKATEEAIKLLQEKTGISDLMDNIMGRFKKIDLNPFD